MNKHVAKSTDRESPAQSYERRISKHEQGVVLAHPLIACEVVMLIFGSFAARLLHLKDLIRRVDSLSMPVLWRICILCISEVRSLGCIAIKNLYGSVGRGAFVAYSFFAIVLCFLRATQSGFEFSLEYLILASALSGIVIVITRVAYVEIARNFTRVDVCSVATKSDRPSFAGAGGDLHATDGSKFDTTYEKADHHCRLARPLAQSDTAASRQSFELRGSSTYITIMLSAFSVNSHCNTFSLTARSFSGQLSVGQL